MVNVWFFMLVISIPFAWTNQTSNIPNFGQEFLPRTRGKRKPLSVQEGLQQSLRKRPMTVQQGIHQAKSRRKRPKTVQEALEQFSRKKPKSVRSQLERHASENDVLPYDNIDDQVAPEAVEVPKVPTGPIPEEVLALDEAEDEEEAAKAKTEGRRKRGRVVGGTDVLSEEEFPFFGTLRNSAQPNCGGTILGKFFGKALSTYVSLIFGTRH